MYRGLRNGALDQKTFDVGWYEVYKLVVMGRACESRARAGLGFAKSGSGLSPSKKKSSTGQARTGFWLSII